MSATKMGGKSPLHLLFKGDNEFNNLLASFPSDEQLSIQSLLSLIKEKYGDSFQLNLSHEKGDRSDILLQKIQQIPLPDNLKNIGFEQETTVLSQDNSNLDIIVISSQPEIKQTVYQDQESGYLIATPENWEQIWTTEKQNYLRQKFQLTSPLTPEKSQENYQQIIKYLKEKTGAYLIFANNCTVDINDKTHNFYQQEDTLSLKLTKLNLVLLKLSLEEGISILNCDQQLAELGAEKNLIKTLEYSSAAHQKITQEFLRVIEDIGFFENRPLLVQMGKKKGK